jgi:hypothetical protein
VGLNDRQPGGRRGGELWRRAPNSRGEHSGAESRLTSRFPLRRIDITPSHDHDDVMHRTTISLDEGVYRRVMRLAQSRGKSLARTIEDLLRASLTKGPKAVVELPLHHENGARPAVDITDRDRLYDLMEGR